MKYLKFRALFLLIGSTFTIAADFVLPASAYAQFSSRPLITVGMSKSEVQARWGQPKLIVDKALIAETVWEYAATEKLPHQKVYFKFNKLTQISGYETLSAEQVSLAKPKLRQSTTFTSAQAFMPIVSQKDLTDVLKDVPSENEAPANKAGQATPAKIQ